MILSVGQKVMYDGKQAIINSMRNDRWERERCHRFGVYHYHISFVEGGFDTYVDGRFLTLF